MTDESLEVVVISAVRRGCVVFIIGLALIVGVRLVIGADHWMPPVAAFVAMIVPQVVVIVVTSVVLMRRKRRRLAEIYARTRTRPLNEQGK